jgi:uncharacterized protein YlzI (FlbEa/FlbD family)
MIKLTNLSEQHRGNPIYINVDHISAVYEFPKQEGGSLSTMVFGGYTGVIWEVEESLEQVLRKIEEQKGN